jgi:hypothetical protein
MNNHTNTTKHHVRYAITLIATFSTLLIASCTTATYGNKFAPDPEMADRYQFKIYVSGGQFGPPERQAVKRIKEFMAGKPYKSYKIVDERLNLFPSYYEFTVTFSRGLVTGGYVSG